MQTAYVALGAQRYRVERNWAQADLGSLCSVAVLADGCVAALLRRPAAVIVLEPDGRLAAQWPLADLLCPHHISARPGGGALVADLDGHQVLALDGDGGEQWRLGEPGRPRWQEPFNHPTHALEWPDGGVWVSDGYGNTVVHRFDAGRRWLGAMGEPGDGPLQFSTPHMLARAADGTVLVADRENHRVQRLDGQGRYLGELRPVHKPMAVAVLPQGDVLVSDQTASLSRFSAQDGRLIGRCRIQGVYGHGLAAGVDGCIHVAEMLPDCLTRLRPD
ncbi:MAG: peptidylglycine monooxygenase [Alcaligenes sp.]